MSGAMRVGSAVMSGSKINMVGIGILMNVQLYGLPAPRRTHGRMASGVDRQEIGPPGAIVAEIFTRSTRAPANPHDPPHLSSRRVRPHPALL